MGGFRSTPPGSDAVARLNLRLRAVVAGLAERLKVGLVPEATYVTAMWLAVVSY